VTGPLKDKRWSALVLLGLAALASLADTRTAEAAQVQP